MRPFDEPVVPGAPRLTVAGGTEMKTDHEALPLDGTLYTATGGLPAELKRPYDYPIEAHCSECGGIIRAEHPLAPFRHTGRKPGDPRD